jgi:hypothetical protein
MTTVHPEKRMDMRAFWAQVEDEIKGSGRRMTLIVRGRDEGLGAARERANAAVAQGLTVYLADPWRNAP